LMSEPSCEWRYNRSSSRRKHLPGERVAVIPWRCNGIAECGRTALL